MRSLSDRLSTIKLLLEADVPVALRYINGLTPYRFTGLYVFESGEARNWYLVDREEPEPDEALLRIPLSNTYCAFVKERHASFRVTDALTDVRLSDHPSRAAVRAYCGAPLLDEFGMAVGSLCHFDLAPVDSRRGGTDDEDLLELVAPLFSRQLAQLKG